MNDLQQKIQKRVEDLVKALSEESMRGKILILTTQIDDLLQEMLKRVLKPARRKNDDELFRPLGPLDSFSSRVAMAYRLGLICESDADALDLLRKIRNDCAHTKTPFSLETEPHLGRFLEFTKLTCQKDYLFLCIGGVICPQTTEDWVIMVCICHIVYMEATLEKLEQTPDKFKTRHHPHQET
jgi:DNA-binding MltR family transcriptional regulator